MFWVNKNRHKRQKVFKEELYFLNKTIGIGVGGGSSSLILPFSAIIGDSEEFDTKQTTYLRLAFILRGNSKTTFFANLYENGDWGFGIHFSWDLF